MAKGIAPPKSPSSSPSPVTGMKWKAPGDEGELLKNDPDTDSDDEFECIHVILYFSSRKPSPS